MAADGIRTVVIDRNENRVQALRLENLPVCVPALSADVADSSILLVGGLDNPQCAGVIALTGDDHVNLTVAISSKLHAPELRVICRAETHDAQANMDSFGTDVIINPFDTIAERFAMMFQSPSMFLVYDSMTSIHESPLREFASPPRGTWVLCGYSHFGRAVQKSLSFKGIQTVFVESDIRSTAAPEGTIEGRGTEAITLYEAGIESAVGGIAGTDDDANNLSIIMTAHDMNKNLFTVARQNMSNNDGIFNAANIDLNMKSGMIIVRRIIDLLTNPLLTDFLRLARTQNVKWANVLVSRVTGILTEQPPETWTLTISKDHTPALLEAFRKGLAVTVRHIVTDPREITQTLPCVPLYLRRVNQTEQLLPEDDTALQAGDQLLFWGRTHAETTCAGARGISMP